MTPYRELATDIGCGDSDIMPKIFAMIANQDEAKLMLAAFKAYESVVLKESGNGDEKSD